MPTAGTHCTAQPWWRTAVVYEVYPRSFADGQGETSDPVRGLRRVRASTLLTLGLPGNAYLYQGEELGLPQRRRPPDEVLQDPVFARTNGEVCGRDGCRVPLPWAGEEPPYAFSPDSAAAAPWLPQPSTWAPLTVEAQLAEPSSTRQLHREVLRLRRALLTDESFAWRDSAAGVLDFERGPDFRCLLNLSGAPVEVDEGWSVLVASVDLDGRTVPHDVAVWLGRG